MMMAQVLENEIIQMRDIDPDTIPEHKKAMWRLIIMEVPQVDTRIYSVVENGWEITDAYIRKLYKIELVGRLQQVAAVKTEAQRRIIKLMNATDLTSCLTKQLNAQMRASELLDKRLTGEELTAEEKSEELQLRAIAAGIKLIRTKSNEIEALDPLPPDWDSDARWS